MSALIFRSAVAVISVCVFSTTDARACKGDLCLVLTNCARTLVMAKGSPVASTVTTFPGIPINLFLRCGTACGSSCPNPPVSVGAAATVTLTPMFPATNPVVTVTTNLNPIPSCSAAGANTSYLVAFNPIPAPGSYAVSGSASVTFNDGLTITARGDTVVCIQPDAPGQPGVPLLAVEPMSPPAGFPFVRLGPGDQHFFRYRIVNNHTQEVMLTAFANSKQTAVRPEGGSLAQGVYAVADAAGDDFPIAFWNQTPACLPLPGHPYIQPEISGALPPLGPGQSTQVSVVMRSWGQCASGSCSEMTLEFRGMYEDESHAEGCAGAALIADTMLPSNMGMCGNEPAFIGIVRPENWLNPVRDINLNFIPDADEIIDGTAQDVNNNAIPDEVEVASSSNYTVCVTYFPVAGTGVRNLQADPKYPGVAISISCHEELETSGGPGDHGLDQGTVFNALLVPPTSGNYQFYTAFNDSGELRLSTDDNPGNSVLIARDSSAMSYRQYLGPAGGRPGADSAGEYDNTSCPIYLEEGQAYFLQFTHKEEDGDDYGSVAWKTPGGPAVVNGAEAIPGTYLNRPEMAPVITGISEDVVAENRAQLTLRVEASGPHPMRVQWYRKANFGYANAQPGDEPLPHGTSFSVEVRPPPGSATGINLDQFYAVISNPYGSVTSSVVRVSDLYETELDVVSAATVLGTDIGIKWDRTVDPATATNPTNYIVNRGSVAVQSATLAADGRTVLLTLAGTVGAEFIVEPSSNIRPAVGGFPYLRGEVTGRKWADTSFIGPPPAGFSSARSAGEGEAEIGTGGSGFTGPSDQGRFMYQQRQGNFRIQVRVDSVSPGTPNARGGLHVRESLMPGSRNVGLWRLATPFPAVFGAPFSPPADNVIEFTTRPMQNGPTMLASMNRPPGNAYPWLQVERLNDLFAAYYSENGIDWIPHSSVTLPMADTVLVGVGVGAHSPFAPVIVNFSQFGNAQPIEIDIDAILGSDGINIKSTPSAGSIGLTDSLTEPFELVPNGLPPLNIAAGEDHQFFKLMPRPLPDQFGRIEGTLTDAQGVAETDLFVQVERFSHPQLLGPGGSFRFRLLPPGLHELIFRRLVEFVDGGGQTNQTNISLSLPVAVAANTGVVVAVKLDLPGAVEPSDPPPCACTPWCGIAAATYNGTTVVVAGGGKLGQCDDSPHITIAGPGGVNVTNPRKGRKKFRNAAPGVWTITATICGKIRSAQITVP